MSPPTPSTWLRSAGAQKDVADGLSRYADWTTLWKECPRGDWLLGIAERLGVDHVALVRAAIGCARVVEMSDAATRVLEVAERWTEGKASVSDVAAATAELEKAGARPTDPSTEAAARAALAVGIGVADRGVLSTAPASAVESVMMASIDCGFEIAMRWAHDKCATAVREAVPLAIFSACVAKIGGP